MANVVKKHNISSELAQKMVDEVVAKVAGMSCNRGAFLKELISEQTKESGPVIRTLISADLSRSQATVLLWNQPIARSPN